MFDSVPYYKSPELRDLSKILNVVDNDERRIAYLAIAEAISSAYVKYFTEIKNINEAVINISKITDIIGEIGIIDRTIFSNILKNAILYKIAKKSKENSTDVQYYNTKSFEEFLGITIYYSQSDIRLINDKYNTFINDFKIMSDLIFIVFPDLKV